MQLSQEVVKCTGTVQGPAGKDPKVTFSVYSQAGDAVIHTEVYIDGRLRVLAVLKTDLQQLAMTLSSK